MPMTEHAATARTPDPAADLQACVALMRTGSRSFFAASRLLPSRVRPASIALYAFCRVADDIVDEAGLAPAESRSLLAGRLDAIYAGCPGSAVEDRALAAVVRQYDLPRPWLDALLDGFAWDAAGRTYETLEEVHDYGARVAGSVGAMMCWLMGVRSPQALARACEMGVAMQLTNIARDVGDDARNGRLYLPRQWLRQAGIDPEAWLAAPAGSAALQSVVLRLLDEADRLYRRATLGVALLPRDCRAAILAARLIYADIGTRMRRQSIDPLRQRSVVPTARKLVLAALASARAWQGTQRVDRHGLQADPLAAVAYLVDHVATVDDLPSAMPRPLRNRVVWMIEMFERVEVQRLEQRMAQRRAQQNTASANNGADRHAGSARLSA